MRVSGGICMLIFTHNLLLNFKLYLTYLGIQISWMVTIMIGYWNWHWRICRLYTITNYILLLQYGAKDVCKAYHYRINNIKNNKNLGIRVLTNILDEEILNGLESNFLQDDVSRILPFLELIPLGDVYGCLLETYLFTGNSRNYN